MSDVIGRVHAINVSDGGVPKRGRSSARVTKNGLEGDRQRNLKYHGGPDRAVCLYSRELIEGLRAEGHPIAPGSIGENLTVTGLEWSQLVPGRELRVGSVRLRITKPAMPCKTIAAAFARGEFTTISEKLRPGWSRWYCRVLEEGTVRVGDEVKVTAGDGGDV